jgi:hypothetical protein
MKKILLMAAIILGLAVVGIAMQIQLAPLVVAGVPTAPP